MLIQKFGLSYNVFLSIYIHKLVYDESFNIYLIDKTSFFNFVFYVVS